MKRSVACPKIHLPNGETSTASHYGKVTLENDLILKNVMYTPSFKHDLISVQKLTQEERCKVTFLPEFCVIEDLDSGKVKGIGQAVKGVYYLVDEPVSDVIARVQKQVQAMSATSELQIPTEVEKEKKRKNATTKWHQRLGHAPLERINKIGNL